MTVDVGHKISSDGIKEIRYQNHNMIKCILREYFETFVKGSDPSIKKAFLQLHQCTAMMVAVIKCLNSFVKSANNGGYGVWNVPFKLDNFVKGTSQFGPLLSGFEQSNPLCSEC